MSRTSATQAHIICCNDAQMMVVLGTEEQAKLDLLFLKRQDELKYHKANGFLSNYPSSLYWHIHTVPVKDYSPA